MLHHLKGIPLQEDIKTWEIRQEPVGLQGEKVFSCSLVRFADCHKVLETISSYPSLFSSLRMKYCYHSTLFPLSIYVTGKKKVYTVITGGSNENSFWKFGLRCFGGFSSPS